MKKNGVPRIHLTVNQRQAGEDRIHPLHVGARLIAGELMLDPPDLVGSGNHLEAAVGPRRGIDSDRHARQQRPDEAVVVPIAIILVPRPRAADAGVFHDHLRVVVVHLAAEKPLGRADDPLAPREHPVDPIPRMVPQREPHHAPLAIGPPERVPVELPVLSGGPAEEINLLTVKQSAGNHVALAVILGDLPVGERLRHGGSSLPNISSPDRPFRRASWKRVSRSPPCSRRTASSPLKTRPRRHRPGR